MAVLRRRSARQGALLGAIDLVRVEAAHKVRDVTILAEDEAHIERVVAAVNALAGVEVQAVSDRTFLSHLGGKLEMRSRVPLKTRDDLSMAYTPGVARVSMAIARDPDAIWNLTIKRNTVAVVSDGSAVLGLGDIGPGGALPVMEGKAILFKEFAGVDAFPICLDTKDVEEIILIVRAIAPVFGGINLEDISAPRCFEIERRLREMLDIPVFHDDQHGTAIVVLAALLNALKVVDKRLDAIKVVVAGVGAAGIAVTNILLAAGVRDIVGCDRLGAVYRDRPGAQRRQERVRGGHESARRAWERRRGARGRRRVHRRVAAGRDLRRGRRADGRARDRVRDGQPDARGASGSDRGDGRGGRDGPLGLPEPDQQRARVSRRLPRRARRPRARDQRGDEGRRRARDRRNDPRHASFPPTTSCRACSTAPSLRLSPPRWPRRPTRPASRASVTRRPAPEVAAGRAARRAQGR